VMPSRETEIRSRGHLALDRDRTLLEGASSPRARRNPARRVPSPRARRDLTRGGDQPSSEAKFYQCGITTLERSEVPPEGVQATWLVGRGPVSLSYACC
jgi:hypothetical protein